MSLPINTVGAVIGAAHLATNVAAQVGQAIGFDQVLNGGTGKDATPESATTSIGELVDRLSAAAKSLLSEAGLGVNRTLGMRVNAHGRVEIDSTDPQSVEIEAILNSNREIVDTARRIAAIGITASQDSVEITSRF